MPSTKFSESEINRAAQLKEQQLYREEGFRKAKPLKEPLMIMKIISLLFDRSEHLSAAGLYLGY